MFVHHVCLLFPLWFRPKQSKSNIERCLRYQDKLWHLQASLAQLWCQSVVTVQTFSIIVIFTRQQGEQQEGSNSQLNTT